MLHQLDLEALAQLFDATLLESLCKFVAITTRQGEQPVLLCFREIGDERSRTGCVIGHVGRRERQ